MDEAFLKLLETKDFTYITVKEICEAAGVNRSTFYLHYETINDLLLESVDHMTAQFRSYMQNDTNDFFVNLQNCSTDELYLVTPKYLTPYLRYIQAHKRIFRTAMENAKVLGMDVIYGRMFQHIFTPILKRYDVPESDWTYIMSFYMQGLMAILAEWLRKDCRDSIAHMISLMQQCVGIRQGK